MTLDDIVEYETARMLLKSIPVNTYIIYIYIYRRSHRIIVIIIYV